VKSKILKRGNIIEISLEIHDISKEKPLTLPSNNYLTIYYYRLITPLKPMGTVIALIVYMNRQHESISYV